MTFTKEWCDNIPSPTHAQDTFLLRNKMDRKIQSKDAWHRLSRKIAANFSTDITKDNHYQVDLGSFEGCVKDIRDWVRAQRKEMGWWRSFWKSDKYTSLITEDNVDGLPEVIAPYFRCLIEKGYRLYFCHYHPGGSGAHCLCIRCDKK